MTRGTPSSNSFTSQWIYDVFINFRGEDTRYGFTGNLYNSLCQRGIHTFIDDQELQRGEQISPALLKAIQGSRMAILVFSQNYASSTFCLIELVQILEHVHEKGQLVLPIFYHVDPSDVRHQRGNYAQALAEHAQRSKDGKEKVQKWRLALHQAANLSGWHFKHGDEYEYEFIRKIVKGVSSKIDRKFLHIAKYPIGLEARVLEVRSLIGVGFNDRVNMIGIHGIGGSGKSTIARALYNLIADQFGYACFLADIREKSLKLGLVLLQEKLISELVNEKDIKLGDISQGIPILERSLHEKKVLLILDDVDKIEQLTAIAGASDWFGLGSTIIITTRSKHLLNIHGVNKKYEVQPLNDKEALELLRWNAFKSNKVDSSYMDILNCVAYYAQGLPLALEVIGSNLFGKSLNDWKSALDRYKRIPNREVQQILKVSYDCLEEDEQEIFLDIASFYRGCDLKYVMNLVQHTCNFHPRYGIGVLIDKSLIKIINGFVTMHGLIHDMGIEIVRQESPEEPGKRSRLWSCEDIIHVLEENTGTDNIKVIIHNSLAEDIEVNWDGEAFMKMKNLKILIIENARFSKGPKYLPNSLRVLTWPGYPSMSLPNDFHPKKLAILELRDSCFGSLEPIKRLENLRALNLSSCLFITQIPDVSGFPNLIELFLDSCRNLVEIHDSVGYLEKLETLSTTNCAKLKNFPRAIKLRYLKHLGLSGCSSLENFPEILEKMEYITKLDLSFTNLELPFSIRNLIGLKVLCIDGSRRTRVPSSIGMLPNVQWISIQGCRELQPSKLDEDQEEVDSMDYSNVKLFLLASNISDEFLPICLTFFVNVQLLDLSWSNFTILPACIKECYRLLYLYLDDCKHLKEIKGIPLNIEELWARNCTSLSLESTSILLSQELHEAGGKLFCVPGSRIPEWLDHYSLGPSISFWFRNEFPAITIYLGMALENNVDANFPFLSANVIINGKNIFKTFVWNVSFSLLADHIFVYDLQRTDLKDNKKMCEVLLESEWNHVEFYTDIPKNVLVEWGLQVIKQESSTEDILFTYPHYRRKLDDPLTTSDLKYHNHPLSEKQHGFVDMQPMDDDFNWDSSSLVSTSGIATDKVLLSSDLKEKDIDNSEVLTLYPHWQTPWDDGGNKGYNINGNERFSLRPCWEASLAWDDHDVNRSPFSMLFGSTSHQEYNNDSEWFSLQASLDESKASFLNSLESNSHTITHQDIFYDNVDNDSDIYDEESRKDDDDYDFEDEEEQSLTSTNSQISESCEVVIEDKGKGIAYSDNPEEEQSGDTWDSMILEYLRGETSDEGAKKGKIFLGSTAEAEHEPTFQKGGKLKEDVNLELGSTSTVSTSTNKGGQQKNGPSNIKISEKDALIKRKAEASVHFKQNLVEKSHTLPESRVNQQSAAKEIEDGLISKEAFITEDNMDAFYASLETETTATALSDTQINTEFVNTRPSEETQKALQILRDFFPQKFSILLQPRETKLIKYILEYLLSLSPDDGISLKTKSVILQLSRSFTRWSLDYNDASHKLESAGADLAKIDELKEGLEANVREFREVEKFENEMWSKLADLEEEKRKLEEQINAIKAQIADYMSSKDTAAQRKRMVFDHGRRLKAKRDDLRNRVPRLRAEQEWAKINQANIEDEWLKLGEKFIASSSFEDWTELGLQKLRLRPQTSFI